MQIAERPPPDDIVRAELARILASDIFARSDRLTAFLTFIVEQTLDGHGAALKEQVLDAPAGNGLSSPATLKQISSAGGAETIVVSGVAPGAWDVTDRGIVFVTGHAGVGATTADPGDALDLYSFADRRVHRLGELPFSVARYGVSRLLAVSPDGRWALAAQIDRWDRDILVADNVR
jgi:hypothetical protein